MIKIWFCVFWIALLSLQLSAKQYSVASFSQAQLHNDIKNQIISQIGNVSNPDIKIEGKNASLFTSLDRDIFYVFVDLAKPETLIGKIILDVTFLSENNTILASKKYFMQSSVYADVFVTSRKISKNDIISASDIVTKKTQLKGRSEDYIVNKQSIIGKQAKRTIVKGVAFSDRWVEIVPDVAKGQHVTLLIKSKGYEIKSDVTALDSGMIGDMIRLKTVTKKILRGKVIDKKHILISSN
ncbi:flagella basal body P-ring formation protein FlgA [bacterium]|nr:flagella basal body P-ring formation protein FlgA [bacterium]|tara:strand:- start:673 stop:1392 length:720 start_codon:yes stop_codon:yes gene_type:complete